VAAVKNYVAQVIARFKALNTSQRAALLGGLLVLASVITGVSLAGGPGEPAQAPAPTTSASATYDPYAYYLAHNPDPSLVLSPQDAGTRAILGCQYPEAQINASPVDKALREAYGPTGICG
jgi:hypothetical protein